jgi:serine/threonine protein kinase
VDDTTTSATPFSGSVRIVAEPVRSIEDFVAVIRKSGLVDDARLEAAFSRWPDRSGPLPEELVGSLIDGGLLTRWQADQLLKGRHKGFVLGKYRLLRLLGAGGMSTVYLAEHATLHSKVAIKVLPVKRVDQSSYLARFEREARQSARLSHANIVRTFDLDTSGSIHFIAMEYVEGDDLHAKVKRDGPLDIREAADYVRQAALGLQHAHEEGLVHRDIKPANLMLDKRGVVKILDLGLAFDGGSEDDSLTREHDEKVLGTADYLAPEQARDSHRADARSDIYALGCTLYYLLVGRAPFAKGTLAERIQAHMKQRPPNLLDARADVPPAIVELFFRMLEKHPDARPQTAREVADSLAAWLGQGAGAAARPDRQPPPRRPVLQRRGAGAGDSGSSVIAGLEQLPGSGPDSSSSGLPVVRRRPAGQTGDSGTHVIAAGAAAGRPLAGAAGGQARPAAPDSLGEIRIDTGPRPASPRQPAAPTAAGKPSAPVAASKPQEAAAPANRGPRRPLTFAGLPIGFWIAVVVGLLVAIGLTLKVLKVI